MSSSRTATHWSYRIYASVAYGSIKSAHLSEYLAAPRAVFLGVQPSDIMEYSLSTDKLIDQDIAALKSELTDPRFDTDYWKDQINPQLKLEKKSEQQAFTGKGLDFVTDTYLPDHLSEMGGGLCECVSSSLRSGRASDF